MQAPAPGERQWLPLESNPDVINTFAHRMGASPFWKVSIASASLQYHSATFFLAGWRELAQQRLLCSVLACPRNPTETPCIFLPAVSRRIRNRPRTLSFCAQPCHRCLATLPGHFCVEENSRRSVCLLVLPKAPCFPGAGSKH